MTYAITEDRQTAFTNLSQGIGWFDVFQTREYIPIGWVGRTLKGL